jgi:hypothetical protein
MSDTRKLLITDSGKGHPSIKRQQIVAILLFLGNSLLLYMHWHEWQQQRQLYWLWNGYGVPAFPSFLNILAFTLIIFGTISTLATSKTIGKMKISVYDDGVEGYGLKPWGLWPKLHKFKLGYNNIESVKKHKASISIRSTAGRYNLVVHNPERIYPKITEMLNNAKSG